MDVSAMLSVLSDHGFDDASDARMIDFLNRAYWDICAREPWPFLEKSVTLSFDDDTLGNSDEWPADFRAAYTPMVVTAGSNVGQRLPYIRYDDWLSRYGGQTDTSGNPQMWYMIGGTAYFYPTPSTATQITFGYLQQPAALADATLEAAIVIPVAFQPIITDGALFRLYAMEDDTDISPAFETFYERNIQNMREFVWRKQYGDNDIVHPTSSEDMGIDTLYTPWSN